VRAPIDVVILQHPREARNPIGTARMAQLGLVNARRLIGVEFGDHPEVRALQAESLSSAVLYPGAGARAPAQLADDARPLLLWVLDGTWWQTHKLWQRNPWLHGLPRYELRPDRPSEYRIRAEPASHCLSTVEAVAAVLDAFSGVRGEHSALLRPFRAMVETQLAFEAHGVGRPPRKVRARAAPRLPEPLHSRLDDVLLVHAEGTGWPSRAACSPPPEIFQWLAHRPATGESFHALLRPLRGLSPKALEHQGLDAASLRTAADAGEFEARWRAFLRPSDLWCSYGHFPLRLYRGSGFSPPRMVDLREMLGRLVKVRLGKLEQVAERLAFPTQLSCEFPGRGGRRLGLLQALFAHLRHVAG
jgi:DTW domain-containing protein YfiP